MWLKNCIGYQYKNFSGANKGSALLGAGLRRQRQWWAAGQFGLIYLIHSVPSVKLLEDSESEDN